MQGPLEMSNRAIEYKLLEELLESYTMFFSHDFDVTHTCQRLTLRGCAPMLPPSLLPPSVPQEEGHVGAHDTSPAAAADRTRVKTDYSDRESRFVWNTELLKPFVSLPGASESGCLLPVMQGFASIVKAPASAGATAQMALIARRDWHRCGYR